jgi:hypothetical protein
MNSHTLTSPSLEGIISNDDIYFEGLRRPQDFFVIRDNGVTEDTNVVVLERYFNDIYKLFTKRLTHFSDNYISDEETLKLQALLQELIKVKGLIENAGRVDIMKE